MSDPTPTAPDPDDTRRKAALNRISAQRAFWRYAAVWVIVAIVMTFLWLVFGRGYFWPIWVIGFMAIGLLFMGINAFGPRTGPPSEERIQQEMDKM